MNTERWTWIGGWGLPTDWLREQAEQVLPFATHTVLAPGPTALNGIDWSRVDRVAGYSFGAFLLLEHANKIPRPALLLAPFFAYPAEAGFGGKIRRAQLRFLLRWLKEEPAAALGDFYRRAELDLKPPRDVPYARAELEWGLRHLSKEAAPAHLPEGWTGVIGDQDPLLDGSVLQGLEPRLQVVPGTGHHPGPLLRAVFRV